MPGNLQALASMFGKPPPKALGKGTTAGKQTPAIMASDPKKRKRENSETKDESVTRKKKRAKREPVAKAKKKKKKKATMKKRKRGRPQPSSAASGRYSKRMVDRLKKPSDSPSEKDG